MSSHPVWDLTQRKEPKCLQPLKPCYQRMVLSLGSLEMLPWPYITFTTYNKAWLSMIRFQNSLLGTFASSKGSLLTLPYAWCQYQFIINPFKWLAFPWKSELFFKEMATHFGERMKSLFWSKNLCRKSFYFYRTFFAFKLDTNQADFGRFCNLASAGRTYTTKDSIPRIQQTILTK